MSDNRTKKAWVTIPPWMIIGAVIILAPIFIFWTSENINKQKENTTRLLQEKGAALIRSFEAGARTGMMGMRWGGRQVQKLLTETAQQPDIVYLTITDSHGQILAHNDSSQIGKFHGRDLNIEEITRSKEVKWRQVSDNKGKNIFEVYRQFSPSRRHFPMHFDKRKHNDWLRSRMMVKENKPLFRLAIFVGLDMQAIDTSRKEDTRHTIIMALILLLIGFTGIILLFLAQSYHATKTSLSRVKAFSDSLVENMPIGLMSVDANDTLTTMNQTAGEVLHLTAAETVGRKSSNILPVELSQLIDNLKGSVGIIDREIEYPMKDGKHILLDVIATELKDEDGIFLEYVILFRDLTEIQRLRSEIERSKRLASLGRLAAGIAHEIRNPLSSIKGFATYFRERYHGNPEDNKTAEIMINEVDRLNRVISQLLEFASPVHILLTPALLQPFLQHSVKMIERQSKEKNVTVVTDFSSEIEEIPIDPDGMSQVLLNLYLNAIEAMDGGGTLSIGLSQIEQGKVSITIADTGKGIDAEDTEKIFDPYFTMKPSGTGLGLAIVHRIIEAHGGEILVESEQGQGTTVSIILPAHSEKTGRNNED